MERIFSALAAQGDDIEVENHLEVYIIVAGGIEESAAAFSIANQLRQAGIATEMDYADKSFKAQMKAANRLHARYAVIIGDSEVQTQTASVKNMESGEQQAVAFADIKAYFIGR